MPSDEVSWYLRERDYSIKGSPVPFLQTPEPGETTPGAMFDPARVDKAIKALSYLRHTKGKWAGQPIVPAPVQVAYIIAPIFGWVIKNEEYDPTYPNSREFIRCIRDAWIEMPRKGAKTTLTSALAMILAFADGEKGAEVILGAGARDQAQMAYKPLAAVAKSSPTLLKAGVVATRSEIHRASDGSYVKTASSRGDLAHGANVHGGLVDELHIHKSPDLLEAIESGTGAREQPLTFIITTADAGSTTSVYAQRREMIEKIAKKTLSAPSQYGVIFAAPRAADPGNPKTWASANPLYPVTPSPAFMRAAWAKAQTNPTQMASFLRLHLGIRSKLGTAYFDLDRWDRNASMIDESLLKGRFCYGGLDLASVSDLTALVWLFPGRMGSESVEDRVHTAGLGSTEGYDLVTRFWMPESAVATLSAATSGTSDGWIEQGLIQVTPGETTDYEYLKRQILKDAKAFDVRGIGFDRWNSSQLVNDLMEEDLPMEAVGQGFASLSAPLKELDRMVRLGVAEKPMLRHGGNKVLRWMADNLRAESDDAGNVKPSKKKSMDKIDGISALTIAMYVSLFQERDKLTAYDDHEVEVV